jgi:hypothetical protein
MVLPGVMILALPIATAIYFFVLPSVVSVLPGPPRVPRVELKRKASKGAIEEYQRGSDEIRTRDLCRVKAFRSTKRDRQAFSY